mmetsp:Transcript_3494/g.10571  ORF Transcript_3494/g.10571 Transcript_3494/m.10571 type:complete len:230 (-) Transcript_3494:80-769(-)
MNSWNCSLKVGPHPVSLWQARQKSLNLFDDGLEWCGSLSEVLQKLLVVGGLDLVGLKHSLEFLLLSHVDLPDRRAEGMGRRCGLKNSLLAAAPSCGCLTRLYSSCSPWLKFLSGRLPQPGRFPSLSNFIIYIVKSSGCVQEGFQRGEVASAFRDFIVGRHSWAPVAARFELGPCLPARSIPSTSSLPRLHGRPCARFITVSAKHRSPSGSGSVARIGRPAACEPTEDGG